MYIDVPDFSKLSNEQIHVLRGTVHELIGLYNYCPTDNSPYIQLNRIYRDLSDELGRREPKEHKTSARTMFDKVRCVPVRKRVKLDG